MNLQTIQTAYGCMLHDFGKIVYRAGGHKGTHSRQGWDVLKGLLPDESWKLPLDCLRWHHSSEIRDGNPPPDHPAYIAYIADNISAAADRREIEGEGSHFSRALPLKPVFTHMNGEHGGYMISPEPQDGKLRMPQKAEGSVPSSSYAAAQRAIMEDLRGTLPIEERINSLLVLLESWTSSFPSSTYTGESPDISLYDHLKTTAAIGCCISEYLLAQDSRDFGELLFRHEKDFLRENCFLLYSADLSGIQRFIYTVSDRQALRSLNSRSFFLGFMMEHYIDEVLAGCGLSRANLLYSGGGHCYLLLPNTEKVKKLLGDFNLRFNNYLLDKFGTGLFLAHGFTPCCGNDLMNVPAEASPYGDMFRRVSGEVAAHKMRRYSPAQLIKLNRRKSDGGRECNNCGSSDVLENGLCPWCSLFTGLYPHLKNSDVCVISSSDRKSHFSLPSLDGTAYFLFTDEDNARSLLKNDLGIRRVYTKNKSCTGLRYSTKIYVGYYTDDELIDKMTAKGEGIRRMAVCRMDVDNLGQSFVHGFELSGETSPASRFRYVTLSRTAAFSRQMTLFFQLYINDILSGKYGNKEPLAVRIVYSGGDDVFLVGAWSDIIEASNRIQEAFTEFSCNSLTISGGIGLYGEAYPIRAAALRTAELEDRAKQEPGKNSVSLFDPRAQHTYGWNTFRQKVQGEKLAALDSFFTAFTELGNSLLYNLMQLIRPLSENECSINLARYAYQLARLEPEKTDGRWKIYKDFADKMYLWGCNPEDRQQLITAIYLYVYKNRKVK